MGTSIFALILSHIGTTYVISLIACEVSAVQDVVPSNSWNLCFGEAAGKAENNVNYSFNNV